MSEQNSNSATTTATKPATPQQVQTPALVVPVTGNQQATDATPAVKPGEPAPAPEAAPKQAPAAYDLAPPDGGAIDVGVVKGFAQAAHRHGIAQEAAQQILADLAPTIAARAQENTKAMHAEWKKQSDTDPRFGGPEKAASIDARIDRVIERLGVPSLRPLLDDSGLRMHPEFRAFLIAAEKATAEDRSFVTGKPASNEVKRVNGMMTNREAASRMPYQY